MLKESTSQTQLVNSADAISQHERDVRQNIKIGRVLEDAVTNVLKKTSLKYEHYPAERDENGAFISSPDHIIKHSGTTYSIEEKNYPSQYVIDDSNIYRLVLTRFHSHGVKITIFAGPPMIPELLNELEEHQIIGIFCPPMRGNKNLNRQISEFIDDSIWSILEGSPQTIYEFSQCQGRRRQRTKYKDRLSVATDSMIHLYHPKLEGLRRVSRAGATGSTIDTTETTGADPDYSFFWRFSGG